MLVFWDLDGTLLTTDRAGIYAWQDALRDITGAEADLGGFETAGHPDYGIARRLLVEVAEWPAVEAAVVRALVERYEHHLPDALPRRSGRVLPNVRDILQRLEDEPAVHSLLLTGNTRAGAAAKLRHYGLARFLSDGAFSEDEGDRTSIARAALARAEELWGPCDSSRVFVVGDTPHDVHCGQAIGARTIAVATGVHDLARLGATRPWRLLPQLPPPGDFLALLADRTAGLTERHGR
jgi:phosphoglycolate phosphatase